MKALRVVLCLFLFLGSAILSRAQVPDDGSDKLSAVATLLPQHHHSDVSGPIFNLEQIEKMALAANPEIRVAVTTSATLKLGGRPQSGDLNCRFARCPYFGAGRTVVDAREIEQVHGVTNIIVALNR
jgi:hypothetical protein